MERTPRPSISTIGLWLVLNRIGFSAKLEEIPDKIPIVELLKGRPMSRADLEKKKLYDLLHRRPMAARHN